MWKPKERMCGQSTIESQSYFVSDPVDRFVLDVATAKAKVKDVQQTTLVNSVTFLTPPIHPSEMSRWSTLTDMVTLRNKTAKVRISRHQHYKFFWC